MGCAPSRHMQVSAGAGTRSAPVEMSRADRGGGEGAGEEEEEQNEAEYRDDGERVTFQTFMSQPNSPKQIFQYNFIKSIGRGAQAEVFVALNTDTNTYIAAKVYDKTIICRKNYGDNVPLYEKVIKEIQIMSMMKHPNCLNLIEVLDDDYTNSLIIMIPYASRGPLLPQCSRTKPIPEEAARTYFQQIALGVQHFHSMNIVHRDIKPENIFVFEDGHIAIGDFSASVFLDDPNKMLEDTDGTPAFSSPEQCTGKPYEGKPADIWACGVTLFEMLYGRLPFFKVSEDGCYLIQFNKVTAQIQNDPLTFDSDVPVSDNAKDLLTHCLDKNPKTRFTIDDVIKHRWMKQFPKS